MYVAPESKVLLALANVAATSTETEPAPTESTGPKFIGPCTQVG